MKILLIEDEVRLARSIATGLTDEGYVVDLAHDGSEGYDLAQSGEYDLLILDLMLPTLDGLSICKKLRAQKISLPILMLTAKSTLSDKVTGLNDGADDYLTKPFDFEELLARIRALSRRPAELLPTTRYPDLSVKESQLLEYLQRHPTRFITKQEIITRVWPYDSNILDNTVEVTIKNIRKKLTKTIIITRRGLGYQFAAG